MIADVLFLLLVAPWLGAAQTLLAVLGVVAVVTAVFGLTVWWARVDDPERPGGTR